jgi:hypothetical protein
MSKQRCILDTLLYIFTPPLDTVAEEGGSEVKRSDGGCEAFPVSNAVRREYSEIEEVGERRRERNERSERPKGSEWE